MGAAAKSTDEKIDFLAQYSGRSAEVIRASAIPEERLNTLFNKASRHEKLSNRLYLPAQLIALATMGVSFFVPQGTKLYAGVLGVFAVSLVIGMGGAQLMDYRPRLRAEIDRAAREKLVADHKPS